MNVKWNPLRGGTRRPQQNISPDPVFRQVDAFYDQECIVSQLREALGELGAPERCEILKVRYYFKRSFQMVYKLYRKEAFPTILTVFFLPRLAALLVGRQLKTCIRHCAPGLGDLAPVLLHCARETLERARFDEAILTD